MNSCVVAFTRFADVCILFFKQKTAYELRISDWSSDVCSSDLRLGGAEELQLGLQPLGRVVAAVGGDEQRRRRHEGQGADDDLLGRRGGCRCRPEAGTEGGNPDRRTQRDLLELPQHSSSPC